MQDSKTLEYLREKAAALPLSPGVYIMENESGKVIYVGKSRALKNRVSSYFHGSHNVKTERMASSVRDFRFIVCDTEMEALALENSLIKQYTPKYNVKLKDAKSYPYIKIDIGSEWPRITMDRKRSDPKSLYFGPYSSTAVVYDIISQLERTLKIPSCKRKFPADIGKERPCLYYQLGRCVGVCRGDVDSEEYREIIRNAANILKGGTREVISSMKRQMEEAAADMEFEKAARLRDSIASIRKLNETQKAVGAPDTECDVIGISTKRFGEDEVVFRDAASVFYVRSGYIADSEQFLFGADEIIREEGSPTEESPMVEFISSLYQSREYIPGEILLSFELAEADTELLGAYLADRAGHRVTVKTPKRGLAKELCDMAVADAARHSENIAKREDRAEKTLVQLASLLNLEVLPQRIEAYDVSNLGDEHITCGMVVAVNGKMKKSEYRSFTMKGVSAQDDYASMAEALLRRLKHIGVEGDSMRDAPDLILLDGGAEHVGAMMKLPEISGSGIPVFGMVKDEHHKTRTLVGEEGEIDLSRSQEVFRLIYEIQEEVHRFSVRHMTDAKRKTLKRSSLEKIEGIGPGKAKTLLGHFRSIAAIKKATQEELRSVPGISGRDALNIYEYFRKEQKEKDTE